MALLCVNQINLPNELLVIIKDYAFLSPERKRIMEKLSILHNIINNSFTKYSNPSYLPEAWFFWIKTRPIICVFCINCGNYLPRPYTNEYLNKINCKCNYIL